MYIIAVINQKGGVGKSTISFNLAQFFSYNAKVGVIDMDVQGTLTQLDGLLGNVDLLPGSVLKSLHSLNYDIVIIDTPPYRSDNLSSILNITNFVLIPVKPSYIDIMAVKPVIEYINSDISKNKSIKSGIVLNMIRPRTSLHHDILSILNEIGMPVLRSTISERVSYVRSLVSGGVFEGEDSKAKEEIINLADEITKL